MFKNKGSFLLKTHYEILTCFVFLLCCSFVSRVEPYNVQCSSTFGIEDFEVYKGIFMCTCQWI
jgi:hypothetical protein